MSDKEMQPETAYPNPYEVGYGKPPKHSQFQKGKSGNPHGRPKGAKSASAIAKEMFLKPVTVIVNGKPKKMPVFAALVTKLISAAMSGDHKAMKLALDTYAKCSDNADPSTIGALMAGSTAFELTAEEYNQIAKYKLLDGVN